jgi:hypothetical protein
LTILPHHLRRGLSAKCWTNAMPPSAASAISVHGDRAQEGHLHVLRDLLPPAGAQDRRDRPAIGAGEPAHVLHDTEHRQLDEPAEGDRLCARPPPPPSAGW